MYSNSVFIVLQDAYMKIVNKDDKLKEALFNIHGCEKNMNRICSYTLLFIIGFGNSNVVIVADVHDERVQ